MAAGGFQWDDLPCKFKVARVQEEKLKPKPGQDKPVVSLSNPCVGG